MKGKFILRVKDTDVKMEFDFDNYPMTTRTR